jgi:hypothetical protein
VASSFAGATVVEIDTGAGVLLLEMIDKEIAPIELGVEGGDELGGRDGKLVEDEAGITIELAGEAVGNMEELAIILEEESGDGDGELGLNCREEGIREGKGLELGGKVGADSIGKNELVDSIEIGGPELDRISELEVWAELDSSIELDTATMLDETAKPDGTELGNATGLENGVVLD